MDIAISSGAIDTGRHWYTIIKVTWVLSAGSNLGTNMLKDYSLLSLSTLILHVQSFQCDNHIFKILIITKVKVYTHSISNGLQNEKHCDIGNILMAKYI